MYFVRLSYIILTACSIVCCNAKQISISKDKDKTSSFLWRIDTEPPSYMFGTVHVPFTKVWDAVPVNAKKAFEQSRSLHLELDMGPESMKAMSACKLLPGEQKLSEYLPADLYKNLTRHVDHIKRTIPSWMTPEQKQMNITAESLTNNLLGDWERTGPIWAFFLITSLNKQSVSNIGVPMLDHFLYLVASERSKNLGSLEAAEDQCKPMNAVTLPQAVVLLKNALQGIESGEPSAQMETFLEDLIAHYRKGNIEFDYNEKPAAQQAKDVRSVEEMPEEEKKLLDDFNSHMTDKVLESRSLSMGKKVVEVLKKNPGGSHFFAVGAGHFSGKDRMQDVVEAAGFRVDHVGPEVDLDSFSITVSSAAAASSIDCQMLIYVCCLLKAFQAYF